MRLGGKGMIVQIKDAAKLLGISVMTCCAVFVCTMFLNYYIDLIKIESQISGTQALVFYQAQLSTVKIICLITGGCLLITTIIMLLFYIKNYIDMHKKELGILKTLGYSNWKIAKNFWTFGISVFLGTGIGFSGAFLIMPAFYKMQNENHILPEVVIHFYPSLVLYVIVIPTIIFSLLAIFYAYLKLKKPVMSLMKNNLQSSSKTKNYKDTKNPECFFIDEVKRTTLKSKKTLVFFIIFASFCFSAMTQMSFSMKELSSEMMGAIIMIIGVILACTTLFLAITTVVNENTKTIAMMRVFGYYQKECCQALLGGYRFMAYIGFVLGTIYQYGLLKLMVEVVFKDIGTVPNFTFDVPAMIISLVFFIIIYEMVMYGYSKRIRKISIKEIMIE